MKRAALAFALVVWLRVAWDFWAYYRRDPVKPPCAPWAWAIVALVWPTWGSYMALEYLLHRALRRLD